MKSMVPCHFNVIFFIQYINYVNEATISVGDIHTLAIGMREKIWKLISFISIVHSNAAVVNGTSDGNQLASNGIKSVNFILLSVNINKAYILIQFKM